MDVGNYQIRAKQFYADVATGTAPLVISSQTKVSNLNVDQVDGIDIPNSIANLLTDHNKAAHDALGINAGTLGGYSYNETEIKPFGSWTNKSNSTLYLAETDGLVVVKLSATDGQMGQSIGYTDAGNPPSTIRGQCWVTYISGSPYVRYSSYCMPVKKGDYWKVVATKWSTWSLPTQVIYWIPKGA